MGTNTKQQKKAPRLRFSDFSGTYCEKLFDDIFTFSSGKNIKQNQASPNFKTPCIRYGELYYMYGEVVNAVINKTNLPSSELTFSKGNEILLPSAGEDPLDIGSASALVVKDVAIGRTINILRPKDETIVSPVYTSYYINEKLRKKISTLAKGQSISNVYNSDLKKLQITLPPIEEQQKIANFLGSVDAWLDNLRQQKTALETYKRGMMQKLFTQQVRFKDENGKDFPAWKNSKVSSLFEYLRTNSFSREDLNYQAGNIYNLHYGDIHTTFSSHFNADDERVPYVNAGMSDGGYPIQNGDVIIADASEDYTDIGKGMEVMNVSGKYIVAGLHTIALRKATDVFVAGYMGHYLKSQQYRLQVMKVAQGAKVLGLSKKHFSQIVISYPVKDEQQKITDFLTAIDQTITAKAEEIIKVNSGRKA